MIADHDRSYYIGASDTRFVVGKWESDTFAKWYGVKEGIYTQDFTNEAMQAGTAYEHRILDSLDIPDMETDKQIIHGRLRVNLDGNTQDTIYEVKTYLLSDKEFKPPKHYIQQVNVEMYAFNIRKAFIVAYGITEDEYKNFYLDIDKDRIKKIPVSYDEKFITDVYYPRFEYLSMCLDEGKFPKEGDLIGI